MSETRGDERRTLRERDRAHVWHPYTQHATDDDPLPIASARGATLTLEDGREIVDAISSWWTCLHGHGRPELLAAMARQGATLDHVLFAGATHEPAVALAEALIEAAPRGLTRVFYSDDGSTAVEIALKIARQSFVHAGELERTVFVALAGGFHGETFGAMAVGDPDPFFRAFEPMLFEVERVGAQGSAVEAALAKLGARAAGVIIEPLVQGAGGMRMHAPQFVRDVRSACDRHGVPMIADEVMTGFGRTGALFACDIARVTPDLLCLAKGLSGGIFPIAATLATERLFESFSSRDRGRAFFHGHSFTANPIGCAVALASLELCRRDGVPARLESIGARIENELRARSGTLAHVRELRRRGGIVALELDIEHGGYLAGDVQRMRRAAIERGVLLRPLGNVIYAMPPACTSEDQCVQIAHAIADVSALAR